MTWSWAVCCSTEFNSSSVVSDSVFSMQSEQWAQHFEGFYLYFSSTFSRHRICVCSWSIKENRRFLEHLKTSPRPVGHGDKTTDWLMNRQSTKLSSSGDTPESSYLFITFISDAIQWRHNFTCCGTPGWHHWLILLLLAQLDFKSLQWIHRID